YTYGFDDGASGNDFADPLSVAYSHDPASTPSVTYGYDRVGRRQTITRNSISTTLSYNEANQLLSESFSGGTLNGLSVEQTYDNMLRRTGVSAKQGAATLSSATYAYENDSSRLLSVTDSANNSATYSYIANSRLVSQIDSKQNSTVRMTATRQYDHLNRLLSISSTPSGTNQLPVSFAYAYNAANQRYRVTLNDGSYWLYTYDALGQVQSGKKYWPDGTAAAGQQFEYTHDDIGNRTQTKAGGDSAGGNLRTATYTVTLVNQYTNRTVPNAVDILGTADAGATVTVNSQATYRKGTYYHKALTLDNSAKAIFPVIKVGTVYGGNSSNVYGKVFLPKTPEVYTHDLDGNLTSDGRWNYVWDAENRLVRMESLASAPPVFRRRLEFEYDWRGRRIKKTVTNLGTWDAIPMKFLYDGWNPLAELNAYDTLYRSYLWGLDLSGTPQGAGGVGGLLSVLGNNFVAYDGNGNVAALVSAADGTVSAQYEYGPFGEVIRVTGPMGKINPIRFSTKYADDESDFLYYGYRYYNPSTGRWLRRDPLSDEAFFRRYAGSKSRSERIQLRAKALETVYVFVSNKPADKYDYLGLQCGITVHRAPVDVRLVWDWPPIEIDAGHEWIEFDGQGYGFWPAGSALYSDGKMHEGDDPHTGERNGRNWDLVCKKTCILPGGEKSTKIVEGTWVEGGIYGESGEKLTIIQAGSGKDKKCPDASCDDIKSCIKAVAAEWKNGKIYCLPAINCRDFVLDVLRRCALNRASQAK
ncbi:MAG: RHS repeat-associated core domain-containing protein, partial [Candidatus Omnitrophica bacterium]|nr:RHS repeat-associated core domain-containing protein [Candidatus Omnitrophota bacterium]